MIIHDVVCSCFEIMTLVNINWILFTFLKELLHHPTPTTHQPHLLDYLILDIKLTLIKWIVLTSDLSVTNSRYSVRTSAAAYIYFVTIDNVLIIHEILHQIDSISKADLDICKCDFTCRYIFRLDISEFNLRILFQVEIYHSLSSSYSVE